MSAFEDQPNLSQLMSELRYLVGAGFNFEKRLAALRAELANRPRFADWVRVGVIDKDILVVCVNDPEVPEDHPRNRLRTLPFVLFRTADAVIDVTPGVAGKADAIRWAKRRWREMPGKDAAFEALARALAADPNAGQKPRFPRWESDDKGRDRWVMVGARPPGRHPADVLMEQAEQPVMKALLTEVHAAWKKMFDEVEKLTRTLAPDQKLVVLDSLASYCTDAKADYKYKVRLGQPNVAMWSRSKDEQIFAGINYGGVDCSKFGSDDRVVIDGGKPLTCETLEHAHRSVLAHSNIDVEKAAIEGAKKIAERFEKIFWESPLEAAKVAYASVAAFPKIDQRPKDEMIRLVKPMKLTFEEAFGYTRKIEGRFHPEELTVARTCPKCGHEGMGGAYVCPEHGKF